MYHQAGNSIVVNVLEEILKSIFYGTYKQNKIITNLIKVLSNEGIKAVEIIKDKNDKKIILDIIGKNSLLLNEDGTYFVVTIGNYDKLKKKITEKCVNHTASKKLLKTKYMLKVISKSEITA